MSDLTYDEILAHLRLVCDERGDQRESEFLEISAQTGDAPKSRPFPGRKRNPLDVGELAQKAFTYKSGMLGIKTATPEYTSLPFDSIAITAHYELRKIQVKCTNYHIDDTYWLNLVRAKGKLYQRGDFDFVAALVIPEDLWYTIPFGEIEGYSQINLYPRGTRSGRESRYEKFREQWDLLR
jgi:hypothetical protein